MLDWRRVREGVAAIDEDIAGFWKAGAGEEVAAVVEDWGRPYVRGGSLMDGAMMGG